MIGNGSSLKWVETGYVLFAESGPEGIQVEKMARILKANKSGFYHYFGDKEIFFSELAEYHDQMGKKFAKEVEALKNFEPGYIDLLLKYKIQLFAQMQMKKHKEIVAFREAFIKVKKRNEKAQNPLWSNYLGIPEQPEIALEMFDIARDMIFTRTYMNELSHQSLLDLFQILKNTVTKIRKLPSKA
jgi:AcrR family transcriptional regulator